MSFLQSSGSLNVSNDSAVFQMMSTLQFPLDKIIDDRVRQVWYVVLKCAMYELFGAFGLVTNVLTLAVLWDMGCHDSSGTTLISLTLSDLVNMLVLLWMGVCYNPFFTYSGVSFDTQSVVYLSGGWLKIYISRVTSWITAFLSVERCLCIAMPFRVKHALTKSRSAYVNAGIFIVIFCMLPPIYATTWLSWQWFPDRNRTLLGLDFSSQRDDVYPTVASVNVVLSYVSFFIILACTVALVVTLKRQAEWRTSTSSGLILSFAKERRVNKMIVLITVLFIVCYFPGTVVLLVMVFIPEFNKGMFYNNLFTVVWAFIHIIEAWNSSFNIFVYYRMSSKFRAVLNSKFSLVRKYIEISTMVISPDIKYDVTTYVNTTVAHVTAAPALTKTPAPNKILNDDMAYIFFVVVKCAMYEVTSVFGIVTNALCLVVYRKMGCEETVNVTLIGLTISDLASLVVLFWMGICFNPLFTYSGVHFDTQSVVYMSGGWVKLYLTRVSSCITAFVTLERCLCIIIPLKIKQVMTPKRAVVFIILSFFFMGMTLPPVYYTTRLEWLWYPARNKTLLGLAFTPEREEIYNSVIAINLVLTFIAFVVIIGGTLMLVFNLEKKTEWRRQSVSAQKHSTMSMKDKKISKMITFIAALFVASFFPGTVLFVVMMIIPEFNRGKLYNNLFTTTFAFSHILEGVNASVNIFIYFKMSSKFRQVFDQTFRFWKVKPEKEPM
ncbi:hypothetical protein Btru_025280 [Bulinus truncatus]|nr:hypothetical protein Btru_025280 [Bulinus truncatus]